MKTKKRTVKPKSENYQASIKLWGRTYTSSGPDMKTAIETLPLGKGTKGMSILEVTHGEKRKSVILPPNQTAKVFSGHGLMKDIAMKQLLMRFGVL